MNQPFGEIAKTIGHGCTEEFVEDVLDPQSWPDDPDGHERWVGSAPDDEIIGWVRELWYGSNGYPA